MESEDPVPPVPAAAAAPTPSAVTPPAPNLAAFPPPLSDAPPAPAPAPAPAVPTLEEARAARVRVQDSLDTIVATRAQSLLNHLTDELKGLKAASIGNNMQEVVEQIYSAVFVGVLMDLFPRRESPCTIRILEDKVMRKCKGLFGDSHNFEAIIPRSRANAWASVSNTGVGRLLVGRHEEEDDEFYLEVNNQNANCNLATHG